MSTHLNKKQTIYVSTMVIALLKAYFSTWAVMRIGSIHSMNIMGLILFLPIAYFYTHNITNKTKLYNGFSSIPQATILDGSLTFFPMPLKQVILLLNFFFSFIFTLMYILGAYKTLTLDVINPLFKGILIAVTVVGLFILIQEILYFLIYCLYSSSSQRNKLLSLSIGKKLIPDEKKLPVFCFILCLFARIPFFLYSYPGIMTPDSINQFEQVLGMKPFSNHHPWIHTLLISLFYHLGSLFTHNKNLAFAFYTVFQIIFMAFAASYLIYVLSKYTKNKPLLILMILFYAFMPYHSVMAICIWKDVLFSGTVLIFCTTLFDLINIQSKKEKTGTCIKIKEDGVTLLLYYCSGILFCLLRSNGWYAFILTIPFLLITFNKSKKIMFLLHFLILLCVLFIKGPVMNHYQVKQPDFVESLSIPLQQVGRVIATNRPLFSQEEEQLSKIMDIHYVPQLYVEHISDPMKELVRAGNPAYLEENKGEFFKLWLCLGLRYPGTYLEAYIEQTKGFYSPSTVYSVAETDGIIDSETGISREYLLRGKIIVKVREILIKLQELFPIYGVFWSMGSLFWVLLLLLYLYLNRYYLLLVFNTKKGENNSPLISSFKIFTLWFPPMAIIATLLLATPVAIEFRYAYHLTYCLPLYLGITFSE